MTAILQQDPLQIKLAQLLVLEILGGVVCLVGIFLAWSGLSGKVRVLLQGPGLKARLTNASPGLVISVVGVVMLFRSLDTEMIRHDVQASASQAQYLDAWLTRADLVKDSDPYVVAIQSVASGASDIIRVVTRTPHQDTTLGEMAAAEYGDARFWKLLAVANKDRGLFTLSEATITTRVPVGHLIEVWLVSKRAGLTREELIRVAVADRERFYDYMLERAKAGMVFDGEAFAALDKEAKEQELGLAYKPIVTNEDTRTLQEVALMVYGSKRFWPLVSWTNQTSIPANAKGADDVPERHTLWILFLLPDREE